MRKGFNNSLLPEEIKEALKLPSGAEYYKCALQVNPFDYLERNRRISHGLTEEEYNTQLIRKCCELEIDVIAITDHNHVGRKGCK